jgi:GTP-binding protein EngB required for normal cell division
MLGRRQGTLLTREKALLDSLREFLVDFDASPVDVKVVDDAEDGLDRLYLIAVVGELNSGKSSFINTLVDEEVCEEDSAPATKRLTLLTYADEADETVSDEGLVERRRPNAYLREVSILDTPPTIATDHQARLQRHFVPLADLVVFVASAERPLTESGRMFLQQIRRWGSKVVMVANKTDLLNDESGPAAIRSALQERAREALDVVPPTFPVSSLLARRAMTVRDAEDRRRLLRDSGYGEVRDHIRGVLEDEERLRIKLEGALAPVSKLHIRYQFAIDERLGLLDGDLKTFEAARSQLDYFLEDMKRDFASRMAEIEALVSLMGARGDAWFERNVRIGNTVGLTKSERVRERFQAEVVASTEEVLDERIGELVDWMVDRNLRQWRQMVDYVDVRRQADYDEAALHEVGDGFEYDREQALLALGETAGRVVRNYDRQREAEQIALSLRGAASRTALAEAGALGMGAGAAASATLTAALAVTLTLGTLLVGGLGLFVLPGKRRELGDDFRKNNEALRQKLGETIRQQFLAELDNCAGRLDQAISQYGEFIRAEQRRVEGARSTLECINAGAEALREEIALPGIREEVHGGGTPRVGIKENSRY